MQGADGLAVGVGERTAIGLCREGEELVDGACLLKAILAKHGHLFGTAGFFRHGAVDLDLADADVGQLAFLEDVGSADAGGADIGLELVLVASVDGEHRGAGFIGAVGEDEPGCLTCLEPDAELEPLRLLVGDDGAGEQGLDGLGVVDVPLGDVAGHDAEDEGFGQVDPEDGGVVVGVAMHGRRLDIDVVEAGDGHALLEVLDVAVAALAGVGVRLFVDVEIAVVEGAFVRALQLLVLHEVTVEAPVLRLQGGLAEAGFDETVGGLEVLVDEEAGGHQGLADGVDVFGGLLLGKVGRETERVHPASEQGGEGAFILTA